MIVAVGEAILLAGVPELPDELVTEDDEEIWLEELDTEPTTTPDNDD
jgi:hypothetical protein